MTSKANSNHFGRLTEERLSAFEQRIGIRLPDSYRSYLLTHNGGVPNQAYYSLPDGDVSSIHHMYGLHEGPTYLRLDHVWYMYQDRIPKDLLPICDDPLGNEVCLGLRGAYCGQVFFWDHESGELHSLAGSFEAFLQNLFEWIDPNESPFHRICRTNDTAELDRLLASGVDPNAPDDLGRTLMEYAAMHGRIGMVQRLRDVGAALREARRCAELNGHADLLAYLDSIEG